MLPAYAQTVPPALSDIPIAAKVAAKPNIVYTVDDSGSMANSYIPDWIVSNYCRSGSGVTRCPVANNTGNTFLDPPFWASDFNHLAYNPNVTYQPPIKADGTPLTYNIGTVTDALGNQNAAANGAPAVLDEYTHPWQNTVSPNNAQYFFRNNFTKTLWCNPAAATYPTKACGRYCPAGVPTNANVPQTWTFASDVKTCCTAAGAPVAGCASASTCAPASCNTSTIYCSKSPAPRSLLPKARWARSNKSSLPKATRYSATPYARPSKRGNTIRPHSPAKG